MAEKTHWHKAFLSDYLGSCDIEEGKTLKCIIKAVTNKSVKLKGDKSSPHNIAEFTDPKIKPMVLNATNCKVIKRFTKSPYINDWVNVPVEIYVLQLKAFGEETEGLRIKDTQPMFNKPELTPTMPAWENVLKFMRNGGLITEIEKKYTVSDENKEFIASILKSETPA